MFGCKAVVIVILICVAHRRGDSSRPTTPATTEPPPRARWAAVRDGTQSGLSIMSRPLSVPPTSIKPLQIQIFHQNDVQGTQRGSKGCRRLRVRFECRGNAITIREPKRRGSTRLDTPRHASHKVSAHGWFGDAADSWEQQRQWATDLSM